MNESVLQEENGYKVTLERFEGPYDKLLEYITLRKLSITEVDLATLADDYVSYVATLKEKDYNDISSFIVVASTLMLMKVVSLLPGTTLSAEETTHIADLKNKLTVLKEVKDAQRKLEKKWGSTPLTLSKSHFTTGPFFVPPRTLSGADLRAVSLLMRRALEKKDLLKEVTLPKMLAMETVVSSLLARLQSPQSLSDLLSKDGDAASSRQSLIVSFLALLELIRLGTLEILEDEKGHIVIKSREKEA